MIDEEMRRRIGALEDLMRTASREGLTFTYRMTVTEACFKRPNVAECSWIVRGACGAVEFQLRIEELAPDRPRVLFPVSDVILHTRAPVWMKDRTCLALGGYWCLCRRCEEFGRELFRLWYERAQGPDCLWSELLGAYYDAFTQARLPADEPLLPEPVLCLFP